MIVYNHANVQFACATCRLCSPPGLSCMYYFNNDDRANTKRYTDDRAIVNVEYKEKGALSKLVYNM